MLPDLNLISSIEKLAIRLSKDEWTPFLESLDDTDYRFSGYKKASHFHYPGNATDSKVCFLCIENYNDYLGWVDDSDLNWLLSNNYNVVNPEEVLLPDKAVAVSEQDLMQVLGGFE